MKKNAALVAVIAALLSACAAEPATREGQCARAVDPESAPEPLPEWAYCAPGRSRCVSGTRLVLGCYGVWPGRQPVCVTPGFAQYSSHYVPCDRGCPAGWTCEQGGCLPGPVCAGL